MIRYSALLLLLLINSAAVMAKERMVFGAEINKRNYEQGDSLVWTTKLAHYTKSYNAVTIQVTLEDLETGAAWRFRFAMLNGTTTGALQIDSSIPDGRYAVNFLLQPDFFNVTGRVKNARKTDTVVQYFSLFKGKETYTNTLPLDEKKRFLLKGLAFVDTALFSFSMPGGRVPEMELQTSLDSSFVAILPPVTKFITIGNPVSAIPVDTLAYKFDASKKDMRHQQLSEVVIKGERKSLQQQFASKYVSSGFQSINEIVFDGLGNDDLARSTDVYTFLLSRVAGLSRQPDTNGGQTLRWRGEPVNVFLDEFVVPEGMAFPVQPTEIAMIKVFRPGNGPLTGGMGANSGAGAIAIYTKQGEFSTPENAARHARFFFFGYDNPDNRWSY